MYDIGVRLAISLSYIGEPHAYPSAISASLTDIPEGDRDHIKKEVGSARLGLRLAKQLAYITTIRENTIARAHGF